MTGPATVVVDIGKSLTKISLWSAEGVALARKSRKSEPRRGGRYDALEVDEAEVWIAGALSEFAKEANIRSIIPIAHGAAAAIIRDGRLVCPPPDYEAPIPEALSAAYDDIRDPFAVTGSPRLAGGLNLGAQLFRLEHEFPGLMDQSTILLWPQYWSWRLSGVAASECTSLGCHTDLWDPIRAEPSSLARRRGWAAALPPRFHAGAALGPLSREWQERTGLGKDVMVHCGLHDSNAALLAARAHRRSAEEDFTVLSTGTWFVAMRNAAVVPGPADLPAGRDCLINVDVDGCPTPSARFMGGREIEILTEGTGLDPSLQAVIGEGMILSGRWMDRPDDPLMRQAAIALYAALMSETLLDLVGSRGRVVIEGRFAAIPAITRTLAALRPDLEILTQGSDGDAAYGAVRLISPDVPPSTAPVRAEPVESPGLAAYRTKWRNQNKKINGGT